MICSRIGQPLLLLSLILPLLTWAPGCSSQPQVVLDSDIPTVPDMSQRLGFDIKRQGPFLVGGQFVFIGSILDMESTIQRLVGRFKNRGWMVAQDTWGFPRSVLLFEKYDRRVRVVLDADQLEPAMSRAQYTVSIIRADQNESSSPEPADQQPVPTSN
ncbi:MAG: hypothetical protein VX641_02175 [Planctomycetota bacterium]|nr:hypothetical protein [Planctomycetota bacterium]